MTGMVDRLAKIIADDAGHLTSQVYRYVAREVIKAIREPTDSMYRAVDDSEDLIAEGFRLNPATAVKAWRLMADAALDG